MPGSRDNFSRLSSSSGSAESRIHWDYTGGILGLYWNYIMGVIVGLYWGLYRDNGKGNGNYYLGFRV